MANSDVVTRTGKGAALSAGNYDQNVDSLSGIVEEQTGATYTVVYTDQNKTIELNNASMTCTMDAIATIAAAIDTTKWRIKLKNTNAADATVDRSSTDTFDGATSLTLKENECVELEIDSGGTHWNIVSRFKEEYVTLDDAQTLTNKTIASPSFTGTGSGGNFAFTDAANEFTQNQSIKSTAPAYLWKDTDSGADEKIVQLIHQSGRTVLRTRTDANLGGDDIWDVTRTGTSVSIFDIPIADLHEQGSRVYSANNPPPTSSTSTKGILELATTAETLAGTDTGRAVTPSGIAGTKDLSSAGYYVFPGGLVLQWGSNSVTGNTNQNITLPRALTTHLQAFASRDDTDTTADTRVGAKPVSTTQIQLQNPASVTTTIRWYSIGID